MAEPCIPYTYPTNDRMAEPCSWQARAAHRAATRSGYSSQMRASSAAPHGGIRAAALALRGARLRKRRRRPSRLHLTRGPTRPAGSAGASRQRSTRGGLARQRLAAARAQAAASFKAAASAPPLPTLSLLRRARSRGRRHSAGLTRI